MAIPLRSHSGATRSSRLTRISRQVSCLLLIGCSSLITPLPATQAVAIELPETAVADDVTVTPVVVHVDTTIAIDKRVVVLTTTAGHFVGDVSSIIPDASGRAVALLRAPTDSAIAIVSATVNGTAASAQITWRRARAERLDLVPEQFTVAAGATHELKIVAIPRRAVGIPSPRGVVSFSASLMADHTPIGRFLPTTTVTDAQGVATVRFTSADTAARGRVEIRAVSDTVSATAAIEVVAP